VIFLGVDWAEDHHDLRLLNEQGERLGKARIPDSLEGVRRLHELVAPHVEEAHQVVVGIETDHGLLVRAMVATGYRVYPFNPKQAKRYREQEAPSGAKSDELDAEVLAEAVRTKYHKLRPLASDSPQVDAIKVLARRHQELIWARQQEANSLRANLREFYPAAVEAFGKDLVGRDALAILAYAPTPERARRLRPAKVVSALRQGGRQRNLEREARRVLDIFQTERLEQPAPLADAYGQIVASSVGMLRQYNQQIAELEAQLTQALMEHPDAEIYLSLPGLGDVLGARVLGEFGDDQTRFTHPKERKAFAGTAPVTKQSGKLRYVHRRYACNDRLLDACTRWAFCSLTHSPGAYAYYKQLRARHKGHWEALRALGNRLVGILHGCLRHRTLYDESIAWPSHPEEAAA
jgi:transposase